MGSAISHPGLLHSCLRGHQGSILTTAGGGSSKRQHGQQAVGHHHFCCQGCGWKCPSPSPGLADPTLLQAPAFLWALMPPALQDEAKSSAGARAGNIPDTQIAPRCSQTGPRAAPAASSSLWGWLGTLCPELAGLTQGTCKHGSTAVFHRGCTSRGVVGPSWAGLPAAAGGTGVRGVPPRGWPGRKVPA